MEYQVSEVFSSIQGEGINSGVPSVFLRFAGCNLSCRWCFVGNTRVGTPTGNKDLASLEVGDIVYGFDEASGKIVNTKVVKLFSHEVSVEEMCMVWAGDRKIFCTHDHEFYVKGKGWVSAKDLDIGDILYDIPSSRSMSDRMKINNPMKNREIAKKAGDTYSKGCSERRIIPYVRTAKQRAKESQRMRDNNPMKNPETVKKSSQNRFQTPSSLEKRYIRKFDGLPIRFTGDNTFAVGDKSSGWVFPDFVVEGKDKVIEIYDTTFDRYEMKGVVGNRTKDWENKRREFLASHGFDVLFLTEKDVRDWREKTIPFVHNGKEVSEVRLCLSDKQKARLGYPKRTSRDQPVEVFNIETETHNYYAESVLVHNCDTPYTWNWEGTSYEHIDDKKYHLVEESRKMSAKEIVSEIEALADIPKHRGITITGGEPMIYGNKLLPILHNLDGFRFKEIETNGLFLPSQALLDLIDFFNVSPKLSSSGVPKDKRTNRASFECFGSCQKAFFKFVITHRDDIKEVIDFVLTYDIDSNRVFLMPEGRTSTDLYGKSLFVSELCKDYGFRYCPRVHIDLYGDRRGV